MNSFVYLQSRRAVIVCIMLLIAAVHVFRLGRFLPGDLYYFYYSYFSDFALPFGGYFLLCAAEVQIPALNRWQTKFAIAFLMPSIAETCQYFGIPVLGSTFDLLDYFMYAVGVLSAVIVDTQAFSRIFGFWTIKKAER